MTEPKTPMNRPSITGKRVGVPRDLRELSYEMWPDRPSHAEFHGNLDDVPDLHAPSTGKAD